MKHAYKTENKYQPDASPTARYLADDSHAELVSAAPLALDGKHAAASSRRDRKSAFERNKGGDCSDDVWHVITGTVARKIARGEVNAR